jgi:hypothetical protein
MAGKSSDDPLARLQEKRPISSRRSYRARSLGLLLAWLGAVGCGWRVYEGSDLLNAVARGAAAWIGFTLVWMAGVVAYERMVFAARVSNRHTAAGDGGQ